MANPTGFYNLEKTGAQITKLLNDAQIDLGGIAKGYIK